MGNSVNAQHTGSREVVRVRAHSPQRSPCSSKSGIGGEATGDYATGIARRSDDEALIADHEASDDRSFGRARGGDSVRGRAGDCSMYRSSRVDAGTQIHYGRDHLST
ncbi:MAG: hypothetical protein JW940_10935 [Polyangiaceae bacterium]|nr:hypothetical protein [Polyangiaceae bacterium]